MWCKMSSILHFLQQFYKAGTLTGFAHFQILKTARQEFTSSNITDNNSQTIYPQNCSVLSQVHMRSQVPASRLYPELNPVSQLSSCCVCLGEHPTNTNDGELQRERERPFQKRRPKHTSYLPASQNTSVKTGPNKLHETFRSSILQMPLHHFGGVIQNHVCSLQSKHWFGWPSGEGKKRKRLYAAHSERIAQSAWFYCSTALSLVGATPMPILYPKYLIPYMKTGFCTVVNHLCIVHHQRAKKLQVSSVQLQVSSHLLLASLS